MGSSFSQKEVIFLVTLLHVYIVIYMLEHINYSKTWCIMIIKLAYHKCSVFFSLWYFL